MRQRMMSEINMLQLEVMQKKRLIETLNPERILRQGYAIVKGDFEIGNVVKITTFDKETEAEIKKIKERQ